MVSHRPDDAPGHSRIVPSAAIRDFLTDAVRSTEAGGRVAAGEPEGGEAAIGKAAVPAEEGRVAGRTAANGGAGA